MKNVGKTLKGWVTGIAVLAVIGFIGIIIMAIEGGMTSEFIIAIIVSALFGGLYFLLIYAIGDITETLHKIEKNTRGDIKTTSKTVAEKSLNVSAGKENHDDFYVDEQKTNISSSRQTVSDDQRIKNINKLYEKEIITKEEYHQALKNENNSLSMSYEYKDPFTGELKKVRMYEALFLLEEDFDFGMFSEEEYNKKRAEIISKL